MILRVLLFLFSISVRSQSLETFSNPNYPFPGGTLVWPLGSVQTIAWETALTSYNITIWQQHYAPNSAKYAQTPLVVYSGNGAGKKTLSWLVQTYDLNLDDSPVFLLWTNWTTGSPSGFTSAYFNISKATISSSSSSSSSQLTASSSLQLPSGTSPASQTQSAINGISSETKIGLGVGLGIGIPLLLILSIMLGLQLIKTCRARETSQNQPPPVYLDHQNYEKTAPPATEQVVYYEAPDNRVDALSPRELSGSLVDR